MIVAGIISVNGFYSRLNDDVMAMPFATTFSDYNLARPRAPHLLGAGLGDQVTAELDSQVVGLVRGDAEPAAVAAAVVAVADDLVASGRSYVP